MNYPQMTQDVSVIADYIKQGRVVAFPTGTSYGLAVDALQGYALQRVRNLKGRPSGKTFTVFMSNELLAQYCRLSKAEKKLMAALPGKPLTLLVRPKRPLKHLAQNRRIGLRLIDHHLMAALAKTVKVPLTATSANRTDESACFTPQCIIKSFPGKLPDELLGEENPRGAHDTTYDLSVAAILDDGELPQRQPTTIAKIIRNKVSIIRAGALTAEELQALL